MDSCACTVGVDYRVHTNHATKLLQLRETEGGEKGEIFVLKSKKVCFFFIFTQNPPFLPCFIEKNMKNLLMSKKSSNFARKEIIVI